MRDNSNRMTYKDKILDQVLYISAIKFFN